MKIAGWILGCILVVIAGIAGLERAAAERIEVVELHTIDAAGEEITTRLWIVDSDGFGYLRVGADGSGWFDRINANSTIDLTRDNTRQTYRWALRPEKSEAVNQLMQQKYTWGDTFIGNLVGGRDQSIPIELIPE